jgi:hypothetical protein
VVKKLHEKIMSIAWLKSEVKNEAEQYKKEKKKHSFHVCLRMKKNCMVFEEL